MRFFISKREYDSRINYNDHFLYIHIPKTGGTSVMNAFKFSGPTHIKAIEIYNSSSKRLLNSRLSFSIVRHPIYRFISLYNYARMEVSHYHNNIEPEKSSHGIHLDYNILREANINECVRFLVEGKLKHDLAWNQWEPQYNWLFDEKDKLLVKKVYKIENVDEFEKDFSKRFGRVIKLPKLNQSVNLELVKKQFDAIDEDSMAMLVKFYKKDFELFNY